MSVWKSNYCIFARFAFASPLLWFSLLSLFFCFISFSLALSLPLYLSPSFAVSSSSSSKFFKAAKTKTIFFWELEALVHNKIFFFFRIYIFVQQSVCLFVCEYVLCECVYILCVFIKYRCRFVYENFVIRFNYYFGNW